MKKEYISIQQVNNKIQYLTEVLKQIETNTILCKTLTGLGATYSEIKAPRHSIISEPNIPSITGKCNAPEHKKDNLFGVRQGITVEDIIDYLERSFSQNKYIKLITTPEGFSKIKQAFSELEVDIYSTCFFLADECDKLIKDIDYRENIILPIDDFFKFTNKAFVSATPIIPSDPRFKEQNFKLVQIQPKFDFKRPIQIIQTNNVLEALKNILPAIKSQQDSKRSICFFVNSTDMIFQLINKLEIKNDSSVFCSQKSVDKLKRKGFKEAYENWDISRQKPFMWFTSRFYTAVDIIMKEKPDVVFITEPYFAEYTIIDPCTDAVQAIGRFRKGTSMAIHIVNTNENFPIRNVSGIKEYLKGCRDTYKQIKNFYECATSLESREAYKAALDVLPYNQMLKNGKVNYFAIDNYINDALVKSTYNNINLLVDRYKQSNIFLPELLSGVFYKFGDKERLKLEDKNVSLRENRMQIVAILESLKDDTESVMSQTFINEMRALDSFIVDAYYSVGKEIIELNKYSFKRIKEAMILKDYREKTTGVEFIQLMKNSFKPGIKYPCKYIKEELKRLYTLVQITPKGAITASLIKNFFKVKECKSGNQRAYLILEPLT